MPETMLSQVREPEHKIMENKYASPFVEALTRKSPGYSEMRVERTWIEFYGVTGTRNLTVPRNTVLTPVISVKKDAYEDIRAAGLPHTHLKAVYTFDKTGRLASEEGYSSLGQRHRFAKYLYPGDGEMAVQLEKGGKETYILRKEIEGVIRELSLTPSGIEKKETLYRLDGRFIAQTKPTGRKNNRRIIAKADFDEEGKLVCFKDYIFPEAVLSQKYVYDSSGRLKKILSYLSSSLWESFNYYYNKQGLCKAIFHGFNISHTRKAIIYKYDALNRLIDCDRIMLFGEREKKHYHYSKEGLLLSVETRHGTREFTSLKTIDSVGYK